MSATDRGPIDVLFAVIQGYEDQHPPIYPLPELWHIRQHLLHQEAVHPGSLLAAEFALVRGWPAVRQALASRRFACVHLIAAVASGGIAAWDEYGRPHFVAAAELARAFHESGVTHVVLSMCDTVGFGRELVDRGSVRSVLAPEGRLKDAHGRMFAQAWLTLLRRAGMNQARIEAEDALAALEGTGDDGVRGSASSGAALLRVYGDPDARIRNTGRGHPVFRLGAVSTFGPHDFARFVGRSAERELLATWMQSGACQLIIVHGGEGIGVSSLARQAAEDSASAFQARICLDAEAPPGGLFDLTATNLASRLLGIMGEEAGPDPLAQAIRVLSDSRVLVRFDHVDRLRADVVREISDLIRAVDPTGGTVFLVAQTGRESALTGLLPGDRHLLKVSSLDPRDAVMLAIELLRLDHGDARPNGSLWAAIPEIDPPRNQGWLEQLAGGTGVELGRVAAIAELIAAARRHPQRIRSAVELLRRQPLPTVVARLRAEDGTRWRGDEDRLSPHVRRVGRALRAGRSGASHRALSRRS